MNQKRMKEWLRRAIRTFIQAAAGYIVANLSAALAGMQTDGVKTVLIGLIGSALAAGMAALMNLETKSPEKDCVTCRYAKRIEQGVLMCEKDDFDTVNMTCYEERSEEDGTA